MTGDWRKLHSE